MLTREAIEAETKSALVAVNTHSVLFLVLSNVLRVRLTVALCVAEVQQSVNYARATIRATETQHIGALGTNDKTFVELVHRSQMHAAHGRLSLGAMAVLEYDSCL